MAVEIERKFLVHHEQWKQLQKDRGKFYRQGYLLNDPQKTIRVRISDDDAFLTIKSATTGVARLEFEYPIPPEEAAALLNNFTGDCIEKYRYEIEFRGHLWEVDEFMGDNEGLIVAEIELISEEEEFELPSWISEEVTDDERYFNAALVRHPYKLWKDRKH